MSTTAEERVRAEAGAPARGRGGSGLDVVLLGLSVTSSWGNGHATNYRALLRALGDAGHRALFLERDVPWYAAHRDLPRPPGGRTELYGSVDELRYRFSTDVARADLVIVGSFVPDGVEVGRWVTECAHGVTAFYDIDTPVTLEKLEDGDAEYLSPDLLPAFDLYLSFTGGPVLEELEERWGARRARPFHCLVDQHAYRPEPERPERWTLGYMGTYSDDRQPVLERLLLETARRRPRDRFVVAGPGYPDDLAWPENVDRIEHLPPAEHEAFYNAQRFTLNVTRRQMVRCGWAPSVRLFEAGACGVPVISDVWAGIDRFFEPGAELLLAEGTDDVVRHLEQHDATSARAIGRRARRRVLADHTAARRVEELEAHVAEVRSASVRAGDAGSTVAGAAVAPASGPAEARRTGTR